MAKGFTHGPAREQTLSRIADGDILDGGGELSVADPATPEALTDAFDGSCRFVFVQPKADTGGSPANVDAVDIGVDGSQPLRLGPSSSGIIIPCTDPTRVYVRAHAAADGVRWTPFGEV